MKIKDLAAQLKNYDEDTPVYIFIRDGQISEREEVLKVTAITYDADENKFWIEGENED